MNYHHPNKSWSDAHEVALKLFIAAGFSMRDIAAKLNEEFGTSFTRNATCGKAFRLGIQAIEKPKQPKKKRAPRVRKWKPTVRPQRIEAIACEEINPLNLSLLELGPGQCRFPYGNGPFVFCGHTQLDGYSYCPSHYLLSLRSGERQ